MSCNAGLKYWSMRTGALLFLFIMALPMMAGDAVASVAGDDTSTIVSGLQLGEESAGDADPGTDGAVPVSEAAARVQVAGECHAGCPAGAYLPASLIDGVSRAPPRW